MVTAVIPEEPGPGNLEHSLREEWALPQIGRPAHIRPHPVLGRSPWIRRRGDINDMKRPGKRFINILPQRAAILAETEIQSLGLANGTPQGLLEETHIQV